MSDTDYDSLTPKPSRAKRTYQRKKLTPALPAETPHGSSSPRQEVAMPWTDLEVGEGDGVGGKKRRRRDQPERRREELDKSAPVKRVRVEARPPRIAIAPASPQPAPRAPSLPPMPAYGTIPSDGVASTSSWVSPRKASPARSSRSVRSVSPDVKGTTERASQFGRARRRGAGVDHEPPSARKVAKGKGKEVFGLPFRLGSGFVQADKSNTPRGARARSPARGLSTTKPTKDNRPASSAKRVEIWRDSTAFSRNAPPSLTVGPTKRFSFSDWRGALPESSTPPKRGTLPSAPGKICGSPFGNSYADQSLSAFEGLSDASSIAGEEGMDDNSSIVLETYDNLSVGGEEDEMQVSGEENQPVERPTEVVEADAEEEAEEDEAEEDETVHAAGLAVEDLTLQPEQHAITPSPEELQTLEEEDIVSNISSSDEERPARYGSRLSDVRPASSSGKTVTGSGGGEGYEPPLDDQTMEAEDIERAVEQSLAKSTRDRQRSSSPEPALAPHPSPQADTIELSQFPSSSHDSSSSPFPPRRPKPPIQPQRPTGPLSTEDDLAYFIATTSTHSSDVDRSSSSAEDERAFRASEREIGYSVKAGRERVEARRERRLRRGGKGVQFLSRERTLRVGEGESEDEIGIGTGAGREI